MIGFERMEMQTEKRSRRDGWKKQVEEEEEEEGKTEDPTKRMD